MATLDDVITVQKNGVIAINNVNQTLELLAGKLVGEYRSLTVTSRTEVARGSGILVAYTVVVAGAAGFIYDSITPLTTQTSGTGGGSPIATITFIPNYVFNVGDTVIVANVAPAGYNGTAVVTASTSNTVSYSNATTGAQTASGTVFNQRAANRICVTDASIKTVPIGAPFTTGLVVEPGAGQSVNVIYSLD
jgi:hypothetical protein